MKKRNGFEEMFKRIRLFIAMKSGIFLKPGETKIVMGYPVKGIKLPDGSKGVRVSIK